MDPKSADKAAKQLRKLLFPEEEQGDVDYAIKAAEMFEKLRKLDLRAFVGKDNTEYVKHGQGLGRTK